MATSGFTTATIDAGGWGKVFYGQLIGKKIITQPDCKITYLSFVE